MIMQDENSIEYLQSLKNKSRNRYQGKPHKPQRTAEAKQEQKPQTNYHLVPYDVLMGLYLEASRRITAQGKRPLPYVKAAEDELNSAWRICLLGWADLDYFKRALDKWERITAGCDTPHQETMNF